MERRLVAPLDVVIIFQSCCSYNHKLNTVNSIAIAYKLWVGSSAHSNLALAVGEMILLLSILHISGIYVCSLKLGTDAYVKKA